MRTFRQIEHENAGVGFDRDRIERNLADAKALAAKYGLQSFDAYMEKRRAIWDEKGYPQEYRSSYLGHWGYVNFVKAEVGRLTAEHPGVAMQADLGKLIMGDR